MSKPIILKLAEIRKVFVELVWHFLYENIEICLVLNILYKVMSIMQKQRYNKL